MKYVFPGTFCPPTYGHLDIATRAAAVFPNLTIVCSRNAEKHDNWFSAEECCQLWQSYNLPDNVEVTILEKLQQEQVDMNQLVMVRGIRDDADYEHEKKVAFFNNDEFGIDKFFYLMTNQKFKRISSSAARNAAKKANLITLAEQVSPQVITALLEKALDLDVYLVVGPPAAGKSTFLKMLEKIDDSNVHINTDKFNRQLRPLLDETFPNHNLVELAIKEPEKLNLVIKEPWLRLLSAELRSTPINSRVFVEAAYGLQEDKRIYRFVGGQVLYVGGANIEQRLKDRQTQHLSPFLASIPDCTSSHVIARAMKLKLEQIDTGDNLGSLQEKALRFNEKLKKEKGNGKYLCFNNTRSPDR